MIMNAKLNETAQKLLWAEAVHTCASVINYMATIGSTKSPFKIFYGEISNIIG